MHDGTCVNIQNANNIAPILPSAPTIPINGTIANVTPSAACTPKLNIIKYCMPNHHRWLAFETNAWLSYYLGTIQVHIINYLDY